MCRVSSVQRRFLIAFFALMLLPAASARGGAEGLLRDGRRAQSQGRHIEALVLSSRATALDRKTQSTSAPGSECDAEPRSCLPLRRSNGWLSSWRPIPRNSSHSVPANMRPFCRQRYPPRQPGPHRVNPGTWIAWITGPHSAFEAAPRGFPGCPERELRMCRLSAGDHYSAAHPLTVALGPSVGPRPAQPVDCVRLQDAEPNPHFSRFAENPGPAAKVS